MKSFLILILLLVLIKFRTTAQTEMRDDSNIVFTLVDKMPTFPGGDLKISEFLSSNFDFSKNFIPERCFYTLTIGKSGEIINVKKLKGDNINEEQLVSAFKKTSGIWTPPSHNGHNVIVFQTLTVEILKNQINAKLYVVPFPKKTYSSAQIGNYTPPKFPNGIEEFSAYAQKYIHYPQTLLRERTSGSVDATIYINKEGKIKAIRTSGDNPEFNNETKRVLKLSPDWIPGSKNGMPIDTMITLQVYFTQNKSFYKNTDICILSYQEPITNESFEQEKQEEKKRQIKITNAKKLNEEGSVLLKDKHFEEALDKFNQAILIGGNISAFLYNRGLTYLNMKQDDKAKADFLEAYRQGDEDSGKIYNDLFK